MAETFQEYLNRVDPPRVGKIYRGQGWVELHGQFTKKQLLSIIEEIDKNWKGLETDGVQK